MKKMGVFLLALVMCIGLAVPALAVPAVPPEFQEAAIAYPLTVLEEVPPYTPSVPDGERYVLLEESFGEAPETTARAPQHSVYQTSYTLNLTNNTYADLTFSIADKNEAESFDSLLGISFYTTNPNGSHWGIVDYNYSFPTGGEFRLTVSVLDMEGDIPSSNYVFQMVYSLPIEAVVGHGRSGDPIRLLPESVCVSYDPAVTYQSAVYIEIDGRRSPVHSVPVISCEVIGWID